LKQKIQPISILIRLRIREVADSFSTNAAKFLSRFVKKDSVVISNRDGYLDGAGAQTQRILSVYCLANYLEIPFRLKAIEKIEFQPVDFIDSEIKLVNEILNLNTWLNKILTQGPIPNRARVSRVKNSNHLPWHLFRAILSGRILGRTTQITLVDGYFAVRKIPDFWNSLPRIEMSGRPKNTFEVHLHLRLANFIGSGQRSMNIQFLQNLVNCAEIELKNLGRKYQMIIHTDFNGIVVDKELLKIHAVPESLRYWMELGILDTDSTIQTEALNAAKEELHLLMKGKPHYQFYFTSHWVDEWISMAFADILIMGKSSYSAMGGLLNHHGLVIGPAYWNSGKPNWHLNDNSELLADWLREKLNHLTFTAEQ